MRGCPKVVDYLQFASPAQHIVGGRKCMKKKFLAIAERKKPKE